MPLLSSYEGDGDLKFVAIAISDSTEQKIADKMVDETFDYLINDIEPNEWTTLDVEGKVTKLSGDGLKYFQEYIVDMGFSANDVVPFAINAGNDGSNSSGGLIIAIVLTVIGLGGTAFMIVRRVIRGK